MSCCANQCFHCRGSTADGERYTAVVDDGERIFCSPKCRDVALSIDRQGLSNYYAQRCCSTSGVEKPPGQEDWAIYDDDDLQTRYVHQENGVSEVSIDVAGMYCSACTWLLETALGREKALVDVSLNVASKRAVVRWKTDELPLSSLLAIIADLGFRPQPVVAGSAAKQHLLERRLSMRRLIVAGIAGMQVMMFAVALYAGDYYGIEGQLAHFLRIVSLLACVPIITYSARPFFVGAVRGLRAGRPGMDVPVALAIGIAFAASAYNVWAGTGQVYFDSVAMFVLFLSGTRYLEMNARRAALDTTEALARLLPETIVREGDDGQETVPLDRLRVGDRVSMKTGDIIPADGKVASGELLLDESVVSGESAPLVRRQGTDVWAGSVNRAGNAVIVVTRTGASTSLAEIGRLLEKAQADRPRLAILADRIASKFVVAMLAIAGLTGLLWSAIDPSRAFEAVLATLVVTCPCALALATPAALAAATSRLAASGLLLVRTRLLERLALPVTFVFDKTGTLTRGQPTVAGVEPVAERSIGDGERLLGIAAAIESESEHVLARAFADHVTSADYTVGQRRAELGYGVEAEVDGTTYRIGQRDFVCGLSGSDLHAKSPQSDAMTEVWLGDEVGLLARFTIADALRPGVRRTLDELRALGHRIVIASGDRGAVVADVARRLSVDDWHGALTPGDKLSLLDALKRQGEFVVSVGDGVNDAPVLAGADASIAVDAGTALARASADSILLGTRLETIVDAAHVASATRRTIRQNLLWAVAYNATAVPLAATGFLAPWMAAVGMSASSLLVVLNALRLRRRKLRAAPRAGGLETTPSAAERTHVTAR